MVPLVFLLLLQAVPPEPLAGALRAAIWTDLELEGFIGNGNDVASAWMDFWGSQPGPHFHFIELVCEGSPEEQTCEFELLRDGGAILRDGREVPDRISCRATMRIATDGEGWMVPHREPPMGMGHTQTTMHCEWTDRAPA